MDAFSIIDVLISSLDFSTNTSSTVQLPNASTSQDILPVDEEKNGVGYTYCTIA